MEINQLKKMKRHRSLYRFMGFIWALVGGMLLLNFAPLLFDPASTILYNGVPTNSMRVKVSATIFCGGFALAGLGFLFIPDWYLNRLFIWRQSMLSTMAFWRR